MKRPIVLISIVSLALIIAFAACSRAEARSLYWESITVNARLDAKGALHISELQNIVFNGEWNGGERWFDLNPGETFTFDKISRYDRDTRTYIGLREGDLAQVDDYSWVEGRRIRWRSRLPSDPPFVETSMIYLLEYTYSNILKRADDGYVLDHEFLFSERDGVVAEYSLELEIDPAWKVLSGEGNKVVIKESNVQPYVKRAVKLRMDYVGKGSPVTNRAMSSGMKLAGLSIAGLVVLFQLFLFYSREKSRGRFEAIPECRDPDEKFLNENIFDLLPEEAGALWDEAIGPPEVTSIIAGWESRKIIKSEFIEPDSLIKKLFGGKEIRLTRLVDKGKLQGYERELFEGLFFGDRETVTRDELMEYYKTKVAGFDPVQIVSPGISASMNSKFKKFKNEGVSGAEWSIVWKLFLISLILGTLAFTRYGFDGFYPLLILIAFIFALWLASFIPPIIFNLSAVLGRPYFVMASISALALTPFAGFMIGDAIFGQYLLFLCYLSAVLLALMFSILSINVFKILNTPEKIAVRRKLISIRNYFMSELSKRSPRLKNEWFPYLVALGLSKYMDRWSEVYGTGISSRVGPAVYAGSGSGTSGGSWTGWGGGMSGGAGASRSWTDSISSISSMSPSASSSSGGGGGGGGGGSSGGGGGGGW